MEVRQSVQLSWSSISSYMECGERFRIERGLKLGSSHTYMATLAGTAFHAATEEADRVLYSGFEMPVWEANLLFQDYLSDGLAKAKEKGIQALPSGNTVQSVNDYGGPERCNEDWWRERSPIFLERWMTWRDTNGLEIARTVDGDPAIEIEFEVDLGEGLRIVGLIDRVYMKDGLYFPVDIKAGKKIPDGYLQLATYAMGLRGHPLLPKGDAMWAAFWSPRTSTRPRQDDTSWKQGRLLGLASVGVLSSQDLEGMYRGFHAAVKAGTFLPNVTGFCERGCQVRDYCWAGMGLDSHAAPRRLPIVSYDPRDDGVDLTLNITTEEEEEDGDS